MFSANENIQLRQYKRRIVGYIEECIPEDALDLGVNVMVMQISCKAPGCVPLETAIVIVFPSSTVEILPGLPESQGGSYKTKVLKPMSAVTEQDILEALPPAFPGGLRSVEKLCLQARDVMLGQITQIFGDEDEEGRRLMTHYLQTSLQEYLERGCTPPELGEPFGPVPQKEENVRAAENTGSINANEGTKAETTNDVSFGGTKNIVIRRVLDDEEQIREHLVVDSDKSTNVQTPKNNDQARISAVTTTHKGKSLVDSVSKRRQQQAAERQLNQQLASGSSTLARLAQREHAPGMRPRGCPCCDPDNPANVVDQLLQF
jgi:hypothetical protein